MKKKCTRPLRCVLVFCLTTFLSFCFYYAYSIDNAQSVAVYKTYRYLVSTDDNATASATCAYLGGGAGYVLERDRPYAAYACYTEEAKALVAQKNLKEKKIETEIYSERIEKIYLKTRREKAQATKIQGAVKTLDDCARFLGTLSSKAERGEYTQGELKDGLRATKKVLDGVAKNKGKSFRNLSKTCRKASEGLEKICEDVALAKDVRFEQIRLFDGIVRFCRQFSL